MMKNLIAILVSVATFSASLPSQACTVFKSPFEGDARFAHNVDWYEQFPNVKAIIGLNAAGRAKVAGMIAPPLKPMEWISRHKSATFTIAGAEFPVSGFNEQGLFMATLVLNATKYPAPEDTRKAVSVTQFVQYNLDMSSTIEDVIGSLAVLRPYSASLKMHYFVCDRSARCAALQFINGQLESYGSLPYDVLTNSRYTDSVKAAESCTPDHCDAQADSSLWRFAEAARLRLKINRDVFSTDALGVLRSVAQRSGITTRFSVTYDPALGRMMVLSGSGELAWVDVDFSRLECGADYPVIELGAGARGDLSGQWKPLTRELQYQLPVSSGQPPAVAELVSKYPFESTRCAK